MNFGFWELLWWSKHTPHTCMAERVTWALSWDNAPLPSFIMHFQRFLSISGIVTRKFSATFMEWGINPFVLLQGPCITSFCVSHTAISAPSDWILKGGHNHNNSNAKIINGTSVFVACRQEPQPELFIQPKLHWSAEIILLSPYNAKPAIIACSVRGHLLVGTSGCRWQGAVARCRKRCLTLQLWGVCGKVWRTWNKFPRLRHMPLSVNGCYEMDSSNLAAQLFTQHIIITVIKTSSIQINNQLFPTW